MNKVCFSGRLTADVELKQTTSGVPVCSFTLAIKRPMARDTTDFINFVAWRNTAEFVSKYFHKGDKIEVTGMLTSRKFQDPNGKNRVAFEVVVETAEFAESKRESEQDAQTPAPKFNAQETPNFGDMGADDLPF